MEKLPRKIIEDIKNYQPSNVQEETDKNTILKMIDDYDDIFFRENLIAHMTASAWVTNKNHDKILMAYHNIYKSYSWLGGHCDGDEDCLSVALREVQEESGIQNVKAISDEIFSLEVLSVNSHIKRDKYVPTHLHLNVTYLIEADDSEPLKVKEDENSAVAWFDIDEAVSKSNEQWFRDNIYSKLNKKLKENFNENN